MSSNNAPASSGSSTDATHSNVYVKNLADEIDDDILRSIFANHGEIRSACVMVDQITKKSRNFGFVKFDDVKSAESAIRSLNDQDVAGRKLVVKLADADTGDKPKGDPEPSDNLYVKGLPLTINPEHLHQMFSVYGNVAQLKILTRPGQGSTGEALVRMADVDQAKWAMQNLHMSTLPDSNQPILVRFADSPEEKKSRRKNTAPSQAARKPANRYPASNGGYNPHNMPPEGFMPLMHPMNDPWGAQLPQPTFGMPPGGSQMAPMPVQGHQSGLCNLYVNDLPLDADDLFLYRTFAPLAQIKGKAMHVSHKTVSKHPQAAGQPAPAGVHQPIRDPRASQQHVQQSQGNMHQMPQGIQHGMQGMPGMQHGNMHNMPHGQQQHIPPHPQHMMHQMPQHHLQGPMHHQ